MNKIDEIVEREFEFIEQSNFRFIEMTRPKLRALLQEAVDAYKKDAERYRWLRDNIIMAGVLIKNDHELQRDKMDRMIDASIAADAEEPNATLKSAIDESKRDAAIAAAEGK